MKRCPESEAALLSVYFEELSLKQQEDAAEARKHASGSASPNSAGMDTDTEIGGDDEIDWFEAQQQGS